MAANTENSGLLKDYYDDKENVSDQYNNLTPMQEALKNRRDKMKESKVGLATKLTS